MVRKLTKSLDDRRREHIPGKKRETLHWQTGRFYAAGTGRTPQPGDLPNQQGVFIIRKGRTRRLYDILPEDRKKDFDPDDTVEDPATSQPLSVRHDGSTTVPGLIGFVDENAARKKSQKAEKAQKKAEKDARRAVAAARSEESSKLSPQERAIRQVKRKQFIERKRERDAEVHDTRQNGFFHRGGDMAGRYYPPFTEYFGPGITRSDLHPMISHWVSTIPARVRVGADKTFVEPHWSKQQGLLFPYVEGDQKFCRWIFRELDGALYDSPESLVAALSQILETADEFKDDPDAKNMLPNLITGHTWADGTFEGGHLIWLLERDSAVWTDLPWESVDLNGEVTKGGDPRCRKAPVEKLKKVSKSLCKLLLPLGADPGQTNFRKPKAPTSPFISVIVANEDNLFELDDFTKIRNYPTHVNVKAMMRDAALIRAKSEGLDETLSMKRWRKTKDIPSAVARAGRKNCDREFTVALEKSISTSNPRPLANWIEREVRMRVAKETDLVEGAGLDWVISKQAVFAAKMYMKPKQRKTKYQPIRGRDRDYAVIPVEVDVTLPIKERAAAERQAKKQVRTARRQEAGRRSGEQKGCKKFYLFKENVYTWVGIEGNPADWNTFRKEGLWACSENTARKYWKRALAELFPQTQIGDRRYIADAGTVDPVVLSRRPPVYVVLESGYVVLNSSVQRSKTVDPPQTAPDNQPSITGPPDRPWPNRTLSSADLRPTAGNRVPEPA
jgi:hypothetical protein